LPVVALAGGLADQVGTDASRTEEHRPLQNILILPGMRDRAPTDILLRYGADILTVAMPAPFADVGVVPELEGLCEGVVADRAEVFLEAVGELFSKLDELGHDSLVGQLIERFLRVVQVYRVRQETHHDEREHEEEYPRNEKHT